MSERAVSAFPTFGEYTGFGVRKRNGNRFNHTRRKNKSLGFRENNVEPPVTSVSEENANILPLPTNKSIEEFRIDALIEQSFPPINTSSNINQLLIDTIKSLYNTSIYYKNIHENVTTQNSTSNSTEKFITTNFKKNIYNVYPVLDDNDFFKLDAVQRIELYNILANNNIDNFKLYCNKYFGTLNKEKYDEFYKSLIEIYNIIFSLPKGSVQHEHSFSIGYTMDFLKNLIEEFSKETSLYSVVYIYNKIEHPHFTDAVPHSLRIVRKEILKIYEESINLTKDANSSESNISNSEKRNKLGPLSSSPMASRTSSSSRYFSPLSLLTAPASRPMPISSQSVNSSTGYYYVNNSPKSEYFNFALELSDNKFTVNMPFLSTNSISIYDLEDIFFITENNKELIYKHPWGFLEFIAERSKGITGNYDIQDIYLNYVAESCIQENIQDIQIKTPMSLWSWDEEGKFIKKTVEESYLRYKSISEEIFTRDIPVRISFIAGKSRGPKDNKDKTFLINTYRHFEEIILLEKGNTKHKIITGYDVYSQEDVSNKNESFIKMFKKLESKYPEIAYVLHTGETNKSEFPADHNLIYAGLLKNSLRVGHAVSLWKYPFLINLYKEKNIGIELCPLSNNLLGYVDDMRNHPALCYINNNLSVSINTDNRGLLNYRYVTYDWMDLCLAERFPFVILKNIAYKSLYQASRDNTYVSIINKLWVQKYNKFLELFENYKKEYANTMFPSREILSNARAHSK